MRELVGQGKPFYSSLDKAAGLLRRKVGTGSEFLKELMSIPGVKQAEIAERGLGELLNAPKMTHEQFMAALGTKPAPAIREKVLANPNEEMVKKVAHEIAAESWMDDWREDDSQSMSISEAERRAKAFADNNAHAWHYMEKARDKLAIETPQPVHEQWTIPGGENYREMLIKAPAPKYSQEKIMEVEAKLRRAAPNMVKHYTDMLNVMKKDAGQNEGFPGVPSHFDGESNILASLRLKDRTGPNGEKLLHLEELQSDWHQKGRERGYMDSAEAQEVENKSKQIAKQRRELVNELTKHEHEHGFISPEMQSRWNAFKEIEDEHKEKTREVNTRVPNAPFKKNWEEMALKRLIHHAAENGYHGIVITPGAEQADRYGLAKHVGMVSYHPGEKRFQAFKHNRETVVNESGASPERVAELIGKEAAQRLLEAPKVGDHHFLEGEDLNIGGEGMKGFYDKKVPNILNSIGKKYGVKTELHAHPIETGREEMVPDNAGLGQIRSGKPAYAQAHYFPITEEMRQDVKKNGIPLYESGGSVSTQ